MLSENRDKLNISVCVFQVGVIRLFEEVNGVVVPTKKAVMEMLTDFINFGNFDVTVKMVDSEVEQFSDNGSNSEIMSLMRRGEIDVTWLPLPMDTSNISGVFSQVAYEDEYRLASYNRRSASRMQDVIHTFTLFDPKIWFIALILTYAIECLLNFEDISFRSIVHLLISCIQRLPSLFFRQYFANRSVVRLTQILGLLFLSIIFGASFNKDMIIGTSQETVNTLRDLINQRKTPIFINGLSEYELFRLGVTKDFRDVYKLAMEKGKNDQYSASMELFNKFTPEFVILASTKIRQIIDSMDYLLRTDNNLILHWSEQTYHKVNQAYLITSNPSKVEVRNRLMVMISRLQQSHIFNAFQERAITEICKDFNLSLHKIFHLRYRGSNTKRGSTNKFYSPLSSSGFQSIRKYYIIFITLSISIFTIECVLSMIIYTNWMKSIHFCKSKLFKL